jgi:multidrug efflux pump subunit AcrA (membrane-fusion protein)
VTATVTSSGNIEADRTLAVDFDGSGGIVKAIYVKPGQRVHKGQVLARVEDTAARQALQAARVQLRSAQASYDATVEGQTPQERAADQQSIAGAAVAVHGAELAVRSARETLSLDRRQHDAAVATAQRQLDSAQRRQPVDQSAVQAARSALTAARQARDAALLADRQQVRSQQQSLTSARQQLASTKATVAVNAEPPRASAVAQAQAQVDSAQIGVKQARTTLEESVLRAPAAGTVAAVNGTVGQSSTSSSSSDSSSDSTAPGFVTLVSDRTLEVTADVAEADINDVKVGQDVAVTISADDQQLRGTVAAVADTSTVTNNVVEYAVTVRLAAHRGVKLGQTAQLVITTGEKQSVLRVASSALTTIGSTTTATVRDADGNTTVRQVTTGLKGDTYTEIVSGLQAGDVVVLPQQSATDSTGFTFPGARVGVIR